eukprot:8870832-Pyramimonas_sp.AAC.1
MAAQSIPEEPMAAQQSAEERTTESQTAVERTTVDQSSTVDQSAEKASPELEQILRWARQNRVGRFSQCVEELLAALPPE